MLILQQDLIHVVEFSQTAFRSPFNAWDKISVCVLFSVPHRDDVTTSIAGQYGDEPSGRYYVISTLRLNALDLSGKRSFVSNYQFQKSNAAHILTCLTYTLGDTRSFSNQ